MNSQWESNPQVKGLYVIQTFQPRIERDSLILNAPSRGYGRRFRTWEIEHTTASRPKVLRIPMGWLALGVWPYCQTSLFHYATVLFELEKDSQWDSNPHAKYPQVPHFMGGVEPPEVAQLDTPIEGARLSISPWEIEKSFSKIIYHGLDNMGQLLPCCFLSQRHEHVYFRADIWLLWSNRRLLTKAVPGSASYTTEHFALPLIQICGSGL